ncbi:hypothetical protein NQ315_016705 [Exocentrus adspersus]|uniref:Uncharacterized protein n=1 Tax=Exocentrus adspersus TaxID=1586481 RepID=A0AAV8VEP8_9CUCU|nr:hypothetical protein NQ315_016705 [Exocentrus adspersus]
MEHNRMLEGGKVEKARRDRDDGGGGIVGMEREELYKYLGYQQARRIDQKNAKELLKKRFGQRLKSILKTKLCAKNMVKAINTYAVPVLTYSFGVLTYTKTELEQLNRIMRTMATKYRIHHPRSSMERLYVSRQHGGRGILDIRALHQKQVKSLREYFYKTAASNPLYKALVINIQRKYTDKINKYLPLANEIKAMWAQEKVVILPLIIGATGEIPQSLIENLKKLQLGQTLFEQLQKIVLLETTGIVRRVMGDQQT